MKLKTIALLSFFILISAPYSYANRDDNMEPAKGFFLPKGDAAAGRKVFGDLKCSVCHGVENDPEFASGPGVSSTFGAKQADYAAGWIANSIVSPSHTIALSSEESGENGLSKMSDFADKMTVRELIDLVAYIKSLGPAEKTVSEGGGSV